MPCFCSDLALRSVPKPGLGMEARAGARGTCAASPECTGRPHSGLGEGARGKGRAAHGQASSWGSKQPHPGLSNTPRAPCSTQGQPRAESSPAPLPPHQPLLLPLARLGCGVPVVSQAAEPSAPGCLQHPNPCASRGSWQSWHPQTLWASTGGLLPVQCHQPWEPTLNHPIAQGCHAVHPVILSHPKKEKELPLRPKAAHPQPKGASGTATLLGRWALPRAASSSSLCNFPANLLPSGPFVPAIVPAIPRAPSLPPPAQQGGGTGLDSGTWCPEKR